MPRVNSPCFCAVIVHMCPTSTRQPLPTTRRSKSHPRLHVRYRCVHHCVHASVVYVVGCVLVFGRLRRGGVHHSGSMR